MTSQNPTHSLQVGKKWHIELECVSPCSDRSFVCGNQPSSRSDRFIARFAPTCSLAHLSRTPTIVRCPCRPMKHLDFSGTKNACHAASFHADFETCRTWQVRHVDGATHLRAPLKLVSEQLLSSIVSRACLPTNQPAEFMSKTIGSPSCLLPTANSC